jgi:alpha-beta hydrolase superfamily lysophospholipase
VLTGAAGLAGCAAIPPVRLIGEPAPIRDGLFAMADGERLPFRAWLPQGRVEAVMLALHGFGDSRDAFELPAPVFAAAGVAVYAPDQRGFGQTALRGRWAGAAVMTEDAAAMLRQIAAWHPDPPRYVLGESMGGAVAMRLAARVRPAVAGYVLVSPAVWGRVTMSWFLRGGLWLLSHGLPGVTLTDGGPVRVRASDNIEALRRLSRDPLTVHGTRFDTLRGLVDLMDDALAAAPVMPPWTLAMYGGHDEVIPPEATAAMWRRLPPPPAAWRAFYPGAYHLMLRDLGRAVPIGDILRWMREPTAPFPAAAAAASWLARQP